jgi:formate dehydrogenase major subunit
MMFQAINETTPASAWFENFWDTKLDDKPGYTVVEIMHKALASR